MARLSRNGFLAISVLFHLIYCYSIFDIYFVSPIVSGMQAYHVDTAEAPAKRIVLFVGDGLRADKAFQSFPDPSPHADNSTAALKPRPLAPFLRSRVLEKGTFGVSHTRVPTESRPGHVALIAGLYEDVSAVTTGWSLNPVNFDSVFNRSRHTWSWGSPDILPMFQKGAVPGRVDADSYPPHAEDYSRDLTVLDTWVFDKVKELFNSAKTDQDLNHALRQDKVVFFLHLLGLDSNGHKYRPYSREYLHNIQIVDQGVREISEMVENFYGDGQTAYVFTADHGMSDWGSHGDGHPDNTRTPLVVWGSGVAKPVINSMGRASGHEDGFSSDWGLDHVQRHDVAQADIAALMAYLAGLDFPVNSVGEIPLSYTNADRKTKAKAILTNAQEILEMYRVKEQQKSSREINYKPYSPLGDPESSPAQRIAKIKASIAEENYDNAVKLSLELIEHGLGGLRYLQTYDWLFLRTLVSAGYLGYIVFALTTVIDLHVVQHQVETSRTITSMTFFSSGFVGLCSLLYIKQSPWTYYAYAIFPMFFWEEIVAGQASTIEGLRILFKHFNTFGEYFDLGVKIIAFVGLLEALVQSYFHREIFTLCYILAVFWPVSYGVDFLEKNKILFVTWVVSCLAMSTFTMLPVIKIESINMITIGGILMVLVGLLFIYFENSILARSRAVQNTTHTISANGISRTIIGVQLGLVILAILVTRSSVAALQDTQGLPVGAQVVGWLVLLLSLLVPFLHRLQPQIHYLHRLAVIFLSFSPVFIILTISYEGLFYVAFFVTLLTWVRLEKNSSVYKSSTSQGAISQTSDSAPNVRNPAISSSTIHNPGRFRALTLGDARVSLFFFFFIQSAFFSTGNIASVSSFSLDAVFRLIPVFDPFSQGALLLLKLMIPFALISANLGILNRRLGVAPSSLFMVVIAIADVMTLNFFYMVKDEGSWLDIGTTISHFCIASAMSIFVAGLELVSEVFVSGLEFDAEDHSRKRGQQQQQQKEKANGQNGFSEQKVA